MMPSEKLKDYCAQLNQMPIVLYHIAKFLKKYLRVDAEI